MSDMISHPPHYDRALEHPSGVECIEITEALCFNLGNAIKYLYRAPAKGRAAEDYRKAAWYLRRHAESNLEAWVKGVKPYKIAIVVRAIDRWLQESSSPEDNAVCAIGNLLDGRDWLTAERAAKACEELAKAAEKAL